MRSIIKCPYYYFESALTDVFCIVFSLTVLEVSKLGNFGFQKTFAEISALFAVAAMIGVIGGIIWILLVTKVFKEHNYMIAIAYLLLIGPITYQLTRVRTHMIIRRKKWRAYLLR